MQTLLRATTFLAALLAAGTAHAASGAYAVDDAAVDAVSQCKIESWLSAAGTSPAHRIVATAPACVAPLFDHRVDLSAAFARARSAGEYSSNLSLKMKTPIPGFDFAANDRLGAAVAFGGTFNLTTNVTHTIFVSVPVTIRLAAPLVMHLNVGYHEDRIERHQNATWGAGFELSLKPITLDKFTLIAETFGNHRDRAAAQAGIRFTPIEKIDFDLIYGYNLTGEEANWITLGLNLRF